LALRASQWAGTARRISTARAGQKHLFARLGRQCAAHFGPVQIGTQRFGHLVHQRGMARAGLVALHLSHPCFVPHGTIQHGNRLRAGHGCTLT